VFLYCIAVAAERTGVLVHALTVMSNHYHEVVTDPFGRLPEFYGWVHEFVAKSLNAHYGLRENFWSTRPTNCARIEDDGALLREIVYTVTNPVKDGLVSEGEDWPGIRLFEPGVYTIQRPSGFFRDDGSLPEFVTLRITPAPLVETSTRCALDRVTEAVREREAVFRHEFHTLGRRFLGANAVKLQKFTDMPASEEPRCEISPRIACSDKRRRIAGLCRLRQFNDDYARARRVWSGGERDVVFPAGTYLMARRHGVAVAPWS
jgi:hypothetical protein